ncbi:MAG: hypothetical protein ACFFCS_23860 [Candidatus Hodarchaeota archaeon]
MLIDDGGRIYLEFEDHVKLVKGLLKKLEEEGIKLEECMFFPVSLESNWLAFALMTAIEKSDIMSAIWSPEKNKPPLTASTKNIVFLEDIIKKGDSRINLAKKWFNLLAKKTGIIKKLKDKSEISACLVTDSQQRYNTGKRLLISSLLVKNLEELDIFPYKLEAKDKLKKLSIDEAMKEYNWQDEWRYLETHEIVLDKLKTELWD